MGILAGWKLRRVERKKLLEEEIIRVSRRLKEFIEERDKLGLLDEKTRAYGVFVNKYVGILKGLIKKAGMSEEEFRRLLIGLGIRGNTFKEITRKAA